jgi:apolipoprotein N-acyltransferase
MRLFLDPARHCLLWSVLSGVVLAFALPTVFPIFGKTEILPGGQLTVLAYFALAPFLVAVEGAGPRARFGLGVVAALSYYTTAIWWVYVAMHSFGGIPTGLAIPILYLLLGYLSVYWGLSLVFDHDIRARFPRWPQWLVLPAVFTGFELVRNYLFSGFPWGNLGYLLVRDRGEAQWASLFGVYGLAFIVILTNSAIAVLWRRALVAPASVPASTTPRWALVALACALIVPRLYGFAERRLEEPDTAVERMRRAAEKGLLITPRPDRIRVALIQGNIDQKIKNAAKGGQMSAQEYRDFVLGRYLPLSRQADAEGADLIVWPEASFPGSLPLHPTQFPDVLGPPFRAELLIGGVTAGRTNGRFELSNSGFAIGPDREVLAQYDKHHLVPFGEYVPLEKSLHLPIHKVVPDIGFFDPGENLNLISVSGRDARFGAMICFDAIFPEIGVDEAREQPDFLVNITNDAWYGFSSASYQFLSMVALRAIETGKPIARAANTGISAFIDRHGNILQHLPIGLVDTEDADIDTDRAKPPQMLMGEVPLTKASTPYVVIGDSFAYLCAIASLAAWIVAKRFGSRNDEVTSKPPAQKAPRKARNANRRTARSAR